METRRQLDLLQDQTSAAFKAILEAWRRGQGSAGGASEVRVISPALRWAQNASVVLIEVKMAHKMSAPAVTSTTLDELELTPQRLWLVGVSPNRRFELSLPLWQPIDTNHSGLSSEMSAGRVALTLRKAQSGHWPALLTKDSRRPSNLGYWFEMQEKLGNTGWMRSGDGDDGGWTDDDKSSTPREAKTGVNAKAKATANATANANTSANTNTSAHSPANTTAKPKAKKPSKQTKAALKALKRHAAKQKAEVDDDIGERKRAVDVATRKQRNLLRDELDAKLMFCDAPPTWLPALLHGQLHWLVRWPAWDLLVHIGQARRWRSDANVQAAKSKQLLLTLVKCLLAGGVVLILLGCHGAIKTGRAPLLRVLAAALLVPPGAVLIAAGVVLARVMAAQ